MGTGGKLGLVAALIAIVVVGFVALKPGDTSEQQDEPAAQKTPAASKQTKTDEEGPTATVRSAPEPPPAELSLRDHAVVGKAQRIEVRAGKRIRFVVSSNVADSVHLHGYDVEKDVGPGKPARFDLPADIEGQFEIESHEAEHVGKEPLIATLLVEP